MESAAGKIGIIILFIVLAAAFAFLYKTALSETIYNNNSTTVYISTVNSSTITIPSPTNPTTTIAGSTQGNLSLYGYALSLINNDRNQYGFSNVTLSGETSGQQHADSMIDNNYFSHWDIYGMKPYMRYSLLGGVGAVSENIAFKSSTACDLFFCSGNINVKSALQSMEYSMMYNDSACCNNGHRENILDPNHNEVSIGVSYNSSSVFFVEDFINDYINWDSGYPNYANNQIYLSGSTDNGDSLSTIEISYDPQVQNMTRYELNHTSAYSYGNTVAGVVSSSNYYYQNITTIVADQYSVSGSHFNVVFNIQNLTSQYGAGEYTIMTWLNDTSGSSFVASTYTLFLGSNGQPFTPSGV